ncbi:lamin tail domain-containing protein [Methanothrix sp.]|uniref:lamin tail domain-containing protein n=1 Tax=Methanothrix sp. TaxID=90426 RepID=UPI003C75EED6
MNMKCTGMLILSMMVAFSAGLVIAQDAAKVAASADTNITDITNLTNVTNVTNMTNITAVAAIEPINVTEAQAGAVADEVVTGEAVVEPPVTEVPAVTEPVSRFKQLSKFVAGTSATLGKGLPGGYSDVTTSADQAAVFSRDSGVPTPSVKVTITKVIDTPEDRYVQVTNEAVGEWNLTAWSLESAGTTTFIFPVLVLEDGKSIKVHEGTGAGTATDIYTNSTEPLWIDNIVTLKDAAGRIIASYDVTTAPVPVATVYVDPWKDRIQY